MWQCGKQRSTRGETAESACTGRQRDRYGGLQSRSLKSQFGTRPLADSPLSLPRGRQRETAGPHLRSPAPMLSAGGPPDAAVVPLLSPAANQEVSEDSVVSRFSLSHHAAPFLFPWPCLRVVGWQVCQASPARLPRRCGFLSRAARATLGAWRLQARSCQCRARPARPARDIGRQRAACTSTSTASYAVYASRARLRTSGISMSSAATQARNSDHKIPRLARC